MDPGIFAPGHCREVVDGLNATEKTSMFNLMATTKILCSERVGTQMAVHTAAQFLT